MTPNRHYDAIVIGGGLQGCSVALHLALRQKHVLLLERDGYGQHASGVNAGGVRLLNRLVEEIPLSLVAQAMWHDLENLVGDSCGFRATGQIRIAETPADLALLETRAAKVRKLGYHHEEMISAAELQRLVPALAGRGIGGLICRGDGYADPARTCHAFRLSAARAGVSTHQGTTVTSIENSHGSWRVHTGEQAFEAPVVVNCAGAWGAEVAAMAGERAILEKQALALMVTARHPHFIDPVIGHASRKLSFKQMENGTVVIGGALRATLAPDGRTAHIDFQQMNESAETVRLIFPFLKDLPIVRCWTGLEGETPDHLPVLGESRVASGVFHAYGFSAHGFQLSPAVGRVMAELIDTGRTDFDLSAFRPERFADRCNAP